MRRAIALIMSLIIILTAFSSCSSSDPIVLFFAVSAKAGSFDPQIVSDTTASIVVRNCFEGLLRKDENGQIVNAVAKSYEVSPDGLTYTFILREDALWHLTSNAKEQLKGKIPEDFPLNVTAYDFEFALKRAVDPATGSTSAYMLYNIEGAPEIMKGTADKSTLAVKAIEKYVLEIKLSQPQSNFFEILTEPVAMPCNKTFFDACMGRYGTLIKFSLSNGPFYLSRFDETSYRINKAADYTGDFPTVSDAIWLYVVSEEEKLLEVLETDDYSGAVISQSVYDKLKVSKKMTVIENPNIIRGFHLNISDEILSDENIRKAILSATDTKSLAENAGRTPAKCIVPVSVATDLDVSHSDYYSEEKAKIYLSAGLQTLGKSSVDISLICEAQYEDSMRRLLQQWQKILGINVNFTVKVMTYGEIRSAVKSGNYQIAFYDYAANTESVYEYFGSFTGNSHHNTTGFSGFGMTEILAKLYSGDEENFKSVYSSIENKIISSAVIIPVWNENTYFVCTKDVSDVIYFFGSDKLYLHNATNIKKKG